MRNYKKNMDNLNSPLDFVFGNHTFDFDLGNLSLKDLFGKVKKHEMPDDEKAIKIFAYAVAMFLSFFGNLTLIVVILSTKSLRTKFNYYILNLAVADILVPLTCMWLHLVTDFNPSTWILGSFFCKINTFSQGKKIPYLFYNSFLNISKHVLKIRKYVNII